MALGQGFRASQRSETGTYASAHNAFITMVGDFGVVGVLLFLLPMIRLGVVSVIRVVKHSAVGSFGFVSVTALLIHNMSGKDG